MTPGQNTAFSVRDWLGLVAGVSWGLVLSRFFSSGDMTGPWLVILLGPPVVLLISPMRPLLSWQLPIVTAVLAGTFMNPASSDSYGAALPDAILSWFLCTLLSSPWFLMFHHRSRNSRGRAQGIPIAYVGMVLIVFACCGVTFVGFALTMYFADDSRNRALPLYGLLAVTAGLAFCLLTEHLARKLEVHKAVRGVFEVLMIPGVVVGIGAIVGMIWSIADGHLSLDVSELCMILVGVEALATMIWLTRLDRQEKRCALQAREET